jgi:serine/threonine-protein kinase
MGATAVVYAATHRNGRRFAIKVLHPELSAVREFRTRFRHDAYLANAVGHPGATPIIDDHLAEDGSPFLVMALLEGESLEARLLRSVGGVPPAVALAVAHQLLDVLMAAHGKGIVHCDIKPGNLFVTHEGELKVLDFGLARLYEEGGDARAGSGSVVGTPAFMAPEQARGEPIDARADLYSLGATLFTLLSGRFVHDGKPRSELMTLAATEPAPPLTSIAPDVPPMVCCIVDRALAFTVENRWQSAARMRSAVASAYQRLTGEPEDLRAQLASPVAEPPAPAMDPDSMAHWASASTTLPAAGLASSIGHGAPRQPAPFGAAMVAKIVAGGVALVHRVQAQAARVARAR